MRFLFLIMVVVGVCSTSNAQRIKRYDFGEPATVVSFIKEVIVWDEGKKLSHESFPGDRMEIYLSDSLVKITEKDTVYMYPIKELRVDEFKNVSFIQEDGTIIRWHRHRRLIQIEPGTTTEEIIYTVE